MSGKILSLHGAPLQHEPVPSVVEALEEALAAAKEGHLRAVAMVKVNVDRTVTTGWFKPPVDPTGVANTVEDHALGNGILTLSWRYGRDPEA